MLALASGQSNSLWGPRKNGIIFFFFSRNDNIREREETVTEDSAESLRTDTSTANVGGLTYSSFLSSYLDSPTFFRWQYIAICLSLSSASILEKTQASMHSRMVALGHLIQNATAFLMRSAITTLILGMLVNRGINVVHHFLLGWGDIM